MHSRWQSVSASHNAWTQPVEAVYYQYRGAQLPLLCRITHKAWQSRGKVGILCDNPRALRELDDQLWSYDQISFLPHAIAPGDEPIMLALDANVFPGYNTLILKVAQLPGDLPKFDRVVDFVPPDPQGKALARTRYRQLQTLGYTPTLHDLTKPAKRTP